MRVATRSLQRQLGVRYAGIVCVCILLLVGLAHHEFVSEKKQRDAAGIPEPPEDAWMEFAEVFFDGARTARENVVGPVNGGWKVAMGTLAFERGASTLGQQLAFTQEFEAVVARARRNGAVDDPILRDRLAELWMRLKILRLNALRVLSGGESRAATILKLYWATWHRDLGELAMDVLGLDGLTLGPDGQLDELQRLFLWTRADTIYAGTNEIQRNLIGERALGLPR